MAHFNVVYGKKDLVAVYKDGDLVATHDKHTKHNGDLKRYLARLESEGHEIEESHAEFQRFAEIPPTADKAGCTCEPKGADENPPEPEKPVQSALTGKVKAEGTVTPKTEPAEPEVPKEIAGRKPGTLSRSR